MEQQHLLTPVTPSVIAPPATTWRDALPTLIGDRVTLRELAPSDAATLAPMLSSPEVARFISAPPANTEQFGWFIEWSRRERQGGRYAALELAATDAQRAAV